MVFIIWKQQHRGFYSLETTTQWFPFKTKTAT
jgi:hypothetical protein